MNERNSTDQRKIPLIRLLVDLASAAMFAAMIVLTSVRIANGTAKGRMTVLILNILLWLIPFIFRPIFKQKISDGIYAVFVIFAFLASFLGSVLGFYSKIWWYDLAIHFAFGYLAAVIGLFFFCKLADVYAQKPLLIMLFCFAVSLMFAVLWEIFELSGDALLGNTAQGTHIPTADGGFVTAVNDTMEDMICNTLGAILFTLHYAAHALSKKSLLFDTLKKDFSAARTQTENNC